MFKSSVHCALKKFKKHEIFDDMKNLVDLRRAVMQCSSSSCHKKRPNLPKNGTDISISIVSRRLSKEFGLKFYKPLCKPRLTSAMKKIYIFCK